MEHEFWHDKWQSNEIGFHEGQPNALLVAHFGALELSKDARVFVPLCGKTKDISWLISQGCDVVGAELSETAVAQLFDENGWVPEIHDLGSLKRYKTRGIDIYVGDIFEVTADMLGPVDAIFDRAALVALPADMRVRYTKHLIEITSSARQLLITFEYDQTVMMPPPHSISMDDVKRYYDASYEIRELEARSIPGGLKGRVDAIERACLLRSLGSG